jgi:DNA-binding transcriptional ArsR family regulator
MVSYRDHALDRVFSALSDPTRRAILARLERRSLSIGELAQPLTMTLPAVLKHVRVLEEAGLISSRKNGRVHNCTLEPHAMKGAARWIDRYRRFWEDQFDALDRYLRDDNGGGP